MPDDHAPGTRLGLLVRLSEAADLPLLVAATGVCVVTLALMGALQLLGGLPDGWLWALVALDQERTLPAAFEAGLLLAGTVLAFTLTDLVAGRRLRPLLAAFGVLLAFMAVDELIGVHRLAEAWTGIRWQLLYVPVGGAAFLAWLAALAAVWRPRAARLAALAGAPAWLVSQLLDAVQPRLDGDLAHLAAVVAEETLEMAGSALFALALLMGVRAAAATRRAAAAWARVG
jgi:hypothetical protein